MELKPELDQTLTPLWAFLSLSLWNKHGAIEAADQRNESNLLIYN